MKRKLLDLPVSSEVWVKWPLISTLTLLVACNVHSEELTVDSDLPPGPIEEVIANEVGFRLRVEIQDPLTSDGVESATSGNVSLLITNRSNRSLYFNRFDTFRLGLKDSNGREFGFDGGRDATRPGQTLSHLIESGATHEIRLPAEWVPIPDSNEYRLSGSEEFGGIWYFDGLLPGTYFLRGIYENDKAKVGSWEPVWTGIAETSPYEIRVP